MRERKDESGVSVVIAVLLMVAITVILAGVVVVWVTFLAPSDPDEGDTFMFDADLEASEDTITVTLISGPAFNTSKMRIKLDEVDVPVLGVEMTAGETIYVPAGIDVLPGQTYEIKIMVNNKVMYTGNPSANP